MGVPAHKQQFSISEERKLLERLDELAVSTDLSRVQLYSIALNKFLKDPHGIISEILSDRVAAQATAKERV